MLTDEELGKLRGLKVTELPSFEYWQDGVRTTFLRALEEDGFGVMWLDVSNVAGDDDLIARLYETIRFPQVQGNLIWPSIEDWLRDLEWFSRDYYVLFVSNSKTFWQEQYDLAGRLAESLSLTSNFWHQRHQQAFKVVWLDGSAITDLDA